MKFTSEQQDIITYDKSCFINAYAGCLTGDTEIKINRAKILRKYSLKYLYESFNVKPHDVKRKHSGWDLSIQTNTRSFCGDTIRLHKILGVVQSGIKPIWELKLEDGKTLKATPDHKILTKAGWVEMKSLLPGMEVMVDTLVRHQAKVESSLRPKLRDKLVNVGVHHPYAVNHMGRRGYHGRYNSIEIHRAIFEAHLNNLTLAEYVLRVKNESTSKSLQYVDPKEYHIHHIDGNHYNNEISNLEKMPVLGHYRHHAPGYKNFGHGHPSYSKVVSSLDLHQEEMTYDIQCEAPHHNFVANGLVVHNSGKTFSILEKIKRVKEKTPGAKVLYITFTRKARFDAEKRLGKLPGVLITNYHSLAFNVINNHKGLLQMKEVDIVPDEYILTFLRKHYGMEKKSREANELYDIYNEHLYKEIYPQRGRDLQIYKLIDGYLERNKKMTYSLLIKKTNDLFREGKIKSWVASHMRYDYIFLDEQQDNYPGEYNLVENLISVNPDVVVTGVGDVFQCVQEDTWVGTKQIKDIAPGDLVPSFRNGGQVQASVLEKHLSSETEGVKVTLESGKELIMSYGHKIYVSQRDLSENMRVVYLMYKKDIGFRVGTTEKVCFKRSGNTGINRRIVYEGADKLWILKVCSSQEEALYYEKFISLKYGVPTIPFKGEMRGMYQKMCDDLFMVFGSNGYVVLKDHHFDFEFPFVTQESRTDYDEREGRFVLRVHAHSKRGTLVSIEFSENEVLYDYLSKFGSLAPARINKTKRYRLRFLSTSYQEAIALAVKIKRGSPVKMDILEKLDINGMGKNKPLLTTAAGLIEGFGLWVLSPEGGIVEEKIIKVEPVSNQVFYDINVEDTNNFFGNGILSHNCIYGYQWAEPTLVLKFIEKFNVKQFKLTANFRSTENILAVGNEFLQNVGEFDEMKGTLVATKPKGKDPVWSCSPVPDSQYRFIKNEVASLISQGYRYKDMFILYRGNKSGTMFEKYAVANQIPFKPVIGSFLSRKIVKNFIGLVKFLDCIAEENTLDDNFTEALLDFADQVQMNVGEKTMALLVNSYPEMSVLDKMDKIDKLIIPGVSTVRKKGIKEFYISIKEVYESYKTYLVDPVGNLATFIQSARDFLFTFKYVVKMNKDEFVILEEDWSVLNEVLTTLPGTLIERISAMMVDFRDDSEQDENFDKIIGMSVHKAKGLENKIVFIIDFHLVPSPFYECDDIHEEERIAYVAATRAEERLYFTSVGDRFHFAPVLERCNLVKIFTP